jgi:hypothetical protein
VQKSAELQICCCSLHLHHTRPANKLLQLGERGALALVNLISGTVATLGVLAQLCLITSIIGAAITLMTF